MLTLFPDQQEFEADIRAAMSGGAVSVLAVAPTGFGKTISFSSITHSAIAKGSRVGIYAHRAELVDQIGRALGKFGVRHGYMAPGFAPDPQAPVQVCSIQAAAKNIDRLVRNPFDLMILDEAHHAAEGSGAHAIIGAHRGKLRRDGKPIRILGVTATPIRLSGEPLSISFDEMVQGPSMADLIRMGRLTPYRLFNPSRPDMSAVTRRAGDFKRAEVEGVMDKPTITGDAVATYGRFAAGKRAIVFCVSIAHAEHVAEQFRAEGWVSRSLDGKMDRGERRRIIAAFSSGEIQVLTSCDIVSEGFDLPAIEVAILLRPTESLALYLQQVGRALRTYQGKQYAMIFDHAGNSLDRREGGRGHGLPDDPRVWSLATENGGKLKQPVNDRPMIVCGDCWRSFRGTGSGKCPYCSSVKDIRGRMISAIDGELIEVDPDLVRAAREAEQREINERVRKTRGLLPLARLAVELGRNEGWVFHTHKARGNPELTYGEVVKAITKARQEAKESAEHERT